LFFLLCILVIYLTRCILYFFSNESGAVLPLSNRDDDREKLRRERQNEYQEYLKSKENSNSKKSHRMSSSRVASVQDKRRQLAEEREKELTSASRQYRETPSRKRYRNYNSEGKLHEHRDPYEELKARKRAEQRRYYERLMNDSSDEDDGDYPGRFSTRGVDPLYRLEEERYLEEVGNRRRRSRWFESDQQDRKVHFNDIEDRDIDPSVSRAHRLSKQRDIHNSKRDDRHSIEKVLESNRSLSAPHSAKGFLTLGNKETEDEQKKRKQSYAEELRQQMKQQEDAKKLERLERFGFKVDQKASEQSENTQDSSNKENFKPHREKLSRHHSVPEPTQPHRDYQPDEWYRDRPPMDLHDHYRPYPSELHYYPPPPPAMYPHHYPPQPSAFDYPYYPADPSRMYSDSQYPRQSRKPPVEVHVTSSNYNDRKVDNFEHSKYVDRSPEGKAAYRQELHRQMEEKQVKKERMKLEQEKYEERLKRDIQEYDPWGKGGGGAPNQDFDGNIITDLRKMRKENVTNLMNGSPSTSPRSTNANRPETKSRQRPPSEQKVSPKPKLSYKEELQQQIAEKERVKQLEKEKQKIEEQKELVRLEKQRIKLQEEYERELAQQKAKEEEARRKNEALKQEAEEKRIAAVRKREEEEAREMKQRLPQKPPTPIVVNDPPTEFRSNSPPVPALRAKTTTSPSKLVMSISPNKEVQTTPVPPQSPPVPALRHKTDQPPNVLLQQERHLHAENYQQPAMLASKVVDKQVDEQVDVLKQLSRMRQEFENEQKKIHRQLSGVSSTTTTTSVPVRPRRIAKDVFQKKPSVPFPAVETVKAPLPGAVQNPGEEFNDLKYKRTSSRLSFMKKYPAPPKSESSLDIQQDALLRHQERDLAKLRSDRSMNLLQTDTRTQPSGSTTLSSHEQQTISSRMDLFGDKSLLEDTNSLANTVQTKLHITQPQGTDTKSSLSRPPSHGGVSVASIATLDVENIAARNEERMRRLDAILNSNSSDSVDPETVIRKFLEKRDHSVLLPQKRRVSEASLDADTRMCPVHDSHE